MATFLMVHGGWHGGWAFDQLRAPLEARGHRMVAPTLPGMGGDAAAIRALSLRGWGSFIVEQARAIGEPVILCGHSRGGIVISEAAEQAPAAFAALVYITAFLVPSGKSLTDVTDAFPPDESFEVGLSLSARGAAYALAASVAADAFYTCCSPADQAMALARLVPEPVVPLSTPLALTEERFGRVPRHYIECTLDRAVPLATQRAMQAALPCTSMTTLVSDHSPFLSMPGALAEALHNIAERIER